MTKRILTLMPADSQREEIHERSTIELHRLIPDEEMSRVLNSERCDIDIDFLGFTGTYMMLVGLIPKHFTVVDLGCGYAPQSYFFTDHERYIGVDLFRNEVFHTSNSEFFFDGIDAFVESEDFKRLNLDTTFFICNYVPEWDGLRKSEILPLLKNVYFFYPA